MQKLDLQRTRAARRLHVAKVPAETCPADLVLFFNALMRATGRIAVPRHGDPVISCTVRPKAHRSCHKGYRNLTGFRWPNSS